MASGGVYRCSRSDIRAIICAQWVRLHYLLPKIDLNVVRNNPKIFCGRSDVTTPPNLLCDAAGNGNVSRSDARGIDVSGRTAWMTRRGRLLIWARHTSVNLPPMRCRLWCAVLLKE